MLRNGLCFVFGMAVVLSVSDTTHGALIVATADIRYVPIGPLGPTVDATLRVSDSGGEGHQHVKVGISGHIKAYDGLSDCENDVNGFIDKDCGSFTYSTGYTAQKTCIRYRPSCGCWYKAFPIQDHDPPNDGIDQWIASPSACLESTNCPP